MTRPDDEPILWRTVEQTAELCYRAPRTIQNLISKHQLPVKRAWVVRNRIRRRILLLSPETIVKLQALTLFSEETRGVRKKNRTTKTTPFPTHGQDAQPSHP